MIKLLFILKKIIRILLSSAQMQHSKLIKILKSLSKEEFIQFRKLLQSPFFVSKDLPLKLYDSIRPYYPDFTSTLLTKERIFIKVFPDRAYNDSKMRAMMLRLTQLADDFLVWRQIKSKENNYQKTLIKAYSERPLFEYYQKDRKRFIGQMNQQPYRDLDYYQDLFDLHQDYFYHPQRQKFDLKDTTLEQMIGCFDEQFMLAKLRFGVEMRNQERLFRKQINVPFLETVLEHIQSHNNNIVLQLFHQLYQVLSSEGFEHFQALEELFFPNLEKLGLEDTQLIYFYCLNYIVRKVNEGRGEFSSKAFEWYRFGLKDDLLIQDGLISEISFGNVVIYGCREKKFDWTKSFMLEYEERLRSQNPKDVIQYNLGLWHFYKGELEEAFSVLNRFEFHFSLQLQVRMTSLRILFEQFLISRSFYDLVRTYSKAFLKYLNRSDKYSESVSNSVKNTIETINTLSKKIMDGEKKEKIEKWINRRLNSGKKIVLKNWILEKIDELK